jgi:hypothetical protein
MLFEMTSILDSLCLSIDNDYFAGVRVEAAKEGLTITATGDKPVPVKDFRQITQEMECTQSNQFKVFKIFHQFHKSRD